MRVTVVFPKWQSYAGKSLDQQRSMNEIYRRYLDLLKNAECSIDIVLEDVQAHEVLNMLGYHISGVVSCLTEADMGFLMKQNNCDNFPDYVFERHGFVASKTYDSNKMHQVDIKLMKEDKDKWVDKRIESYRKRLKYSMEEYLKESNAALVFRFNNANDRVASPTQWMTVGDGKLYMEVDMNSGSVASYYGGVYVTDDLLPTILSMSEALWKG